MDRAGAPLLALYCRNGSLLQCSRQVENYNVAIHQFPALLLARVLGFKSAQPI